MVACSVVFLTGCATDQGGVQINSKIPTLKSPRTINNYDGLASWYNYGTRTANGEKYYPNNIKDYTVAHKTLAFNTKLKLTNTENGKTIIARVNDRGPYIKGREIDVSEAAAKALGFFENGVAKLHIEILDE